MLYLVNREKQLLSTVKRATRQGFSADTQYDAVKAAREKRKKKAQRNQEQVMAGGWTNIPIIQAK